MVDDIFVPFGNICSKSDAMYLCLNKIWQFSSWAPIRSNLWWQCYVWLLNGEYRHILVRSEIGRRYVRFKELHTYGSAIHVSGVQCIRVSFNAKQVSVVRCRCCIVFCDNNWLVVVWYVKDSIQESLLICATLPIHWMAFLLFWNRFTNVQHNYDMESNDASFR